MKAKWLLLVCMMALASAGCASNQIITAPKTEVMPGEVEGWSVWQESHSYDSETLHELVGDQTGIYTAYGFEQVDVKRYKTPDGLMMSIEVWRMDRPDSAYGLMTRLGKGMDDNQGNGGRRDPGERLVFWKDRYFVNIYTSQMMEDPAVVYFGELVDQQLPRGGVTPEIVSRLPELGLEREHVVYFHEESSFAHELSLGGKNLLGLSDKTNGVVARYDLNGRRMYLLMVEYRGEGAASNALASLQNGGLGNLVLARSSGNMLLAVFGNVDAQTADMIMQDALTE